MLRDPVYTDYKVPEVYALYPDVNQIVTKLADISVGMHLHRYSRIARGRHDLLAGELFDERCRDEISFFKRTLRANNG